MSLLTTSCGWIEQLGHKDGGGGGDAPHVDQYAESQVQPRTAAPSVGTGAVASSASLAPPVKLKDGQFVGPDGQVQPLHGFNYFGFNTDLGAVHGLWNGADPMLDFQRVVYRQKLLGFNAVRLPFSFAQFPKEPKNFETDCPDLDDLEVVKSTISPDAKDVDPTKAPKLAFQLPRRPGKCNSLETATTRARYLQAVEMYVKNGFYVLLDNHYREDRTAETDQRNWLEGWKQLAQELLSKEEYQGRIFFDLLNEPGQYGQRWEKTDKAGIQELYLAAMDAVWSVSDKAIFFIEGTGQESLGANWGDGYCTDGTRVAQLGLSDPRPFFQALKAKPYASAVALAPHCYGPKVTFASKDFSGPGLYQRLSASFGSFNSAAGPAELSGVRLPVAVGEFGSHFNDDSDVHFMQDFAAYLGNQGEAKDGKHDPINAWFYWCWNNDSGDTGGLVQDNWKDIEWVKISYLQTLGLTPWYKEKAPSTAQPRPPDQSASAQNQGPATAAAIPSTASQSAEAPTTPQDKPTTTALPRPANPSDATASSSPKNPTTAPFATSPAPQKGPEPSDAAMSGSPATSKPTGSSTSAPTPQDKPPTNEQMAAGWGQPASILKPGASPTSPSPSGPTNGGPKTPSSTLPTPTPNAATEGSPAQVQPPIHQPSPSAQPPAPPTSSTPPPASGQTPPASPSSQQIPKTEPPAALSPIKTGAEVSPTPSRPGTPPATRGPVALVSTPPPADGKIHATIHLDSSWDGGDGKKYFAYQLHLVNMSQERFVPPYQIVLSGPKFSSLWQSWNIDEAKVKDGEIDGRIVAAWACLEPQGRSAVVLGVVASADAQDGEITSIKINGTEVKIDAGHPGT